ncbi:MAG: MMPL family transporter [Myxococcales bacterium]|nr:MMPL family transporter [Myxococcales bacterium]
MSSEGYRRLIVAAVVAALLAAFVVSRFQVSADITTFLPTGDDRSIGEFSRAVARGPLSRTMVLVLAAEDRASVVTASRRFERALIEHRDVGPHLESIEGGYSEGTERKLWDLYHPRRFGFVAQDEDAARARASDEALRSSAELLVRRLRHPDSSAIARLAPSDPLLILPDLFRRVQEAAGRQLRLVDGRFLTRESPEAVLLLTTSASAFDASVQGPLLAGIESSFHGLRETMPSVTGLQQSGINRFAVRAEQSIRADIQRITVLSCLGLGLLLWVLFRGFRLVGLAAITVGLGVLAGCSVVLALFGRIHGITLAFGASLIGVCVDYVIHFYCHQSVAPSPDGPYGTLRRIWKALATGAATTMIGFAALSASSFPGLREVGLFSATGIAAALAATRFIVPSLLPAKPRPVAFRQWLVDGLGRGYRWLRSNRLAPSLIVAASIALALAGASRARWNQDFTSLNRVDPELFAEDQTVRSKVMQIEQMRFVVALGSNDEDALQVNDAVVLALAEARAANEVDEYQSIGDLLPSAQRQTAVARAFHDSPKLWERTARAYAAAGFDATAFTPFQKALAAPPAPPLTFADLLRSPLASLVRKYRIELGDEVAWLSFLHEVHDPVALERRLANIPGARLIDQAQLMQEANRAYQQRTLELISLGLLGVLLMLVIRYRDVRKVFAAFFPSLLAAAVTVSILTFAGLGLDLVSLTALLVVVSVGVDYGVFLVDADSAGEVDRSAALLSIVVACGSTVLGFGLLSLSSYPALHVIGLTAVVGVITSFVLAPSALMLTTRTPR